MTQLTGQQIAQDAYNAGFRGDALIQAVAISKRESGWYTDAYNGDVSTGDNSVGLMQINILGNGLQSVENILHNLGINASSRDSVIQALNDPVTNFKVAYAMSSGGTDGFYDWGPYKGQPALYNTDISGAINAVANAGLPSGGTMPSLPQGIFGTGSGSATGNPDGSTTGGATKQCPPAGSIFSPSWFVNRLCQFGFAPKLGTSSNGTQTIDPGNEVGGDRTATIFDQLGNLLGWITDYHNWVKVGLILAGTILSITGLIFILKSQSSGSTIIVTE